LATLITLEQGKPLAESRAEVDYAAGFYRHFAGCLDALALRRLGSSERGRWTVHHRPAGGAALITPWNFPLAMMAKKLAAALGAGCACVCKPASRTPLTMLALFHLLEELRLPRWNVQLVLGAAGPIGEVLCTHPA